MTREEILNYFKDINFMYNNPSMFDTLKRMLDELTEPCEDAVSRSELKRRLQEHHDFFVNSYGGFSNMPLNDKARVDEITHCIAEIVNMPSVQPERPKGKWENANDSWLVCGECGFSYNSEEYSVFPYCPCCGAEMEGESE